MIISHNYEVWKGRCKKPLEPNLTQRMLNELSPSPTPMTKDRSRCGHARRMSGLWRLECFQFHQQPLILNQQVIALTSNQIDGAKTHIVRYFIGHG